jgi:hypothetical protein
MITHLIKIVLTGAVVAGSYYSYINFNFTEAAKYIDEIKNAFAQEECYIEDALQSGKDEIQKCVIDNIKEEQDYYTSGSMFQSAVWSDDTLTITNHTEVIAALIEDSNTLNIIGADGKNYSLDIEYYKILEDKTVIRVDKNSKDYNFNDLYLMGIVSEAQ